MPKKNLVLIHGWGFNSHIWFDLLDDLNQYFQITLIDLPHYDALTLQADWLKLHVPERAIYLAWSLGGLLATVFAKKYPGRVEAIIHIASTPCFIEQLNWPGIDANIFYEFSNELKYNREKAMAKFFRFQFIAGKNYRPYKQLLTVSFMKDEGRLNDDLTMLINTDHRVVIKQLTCRQLFILGQHDQLVPYAIGTRLSEYSQLIDTITFKQSAHAPFLTEQKKCINQIVNFSYA